MKVYFLALAVMIGSSACKGLYQDGISSNNNPICQQSSGKAIVGMGRQSSEAYIFDNTNFADPLAWCSKKGAVISSIKNMSGSTYSVAHIDANGSRFPFITLKPQDTFTFNTNVATERFNVAGGWS